MVRRRKAKLGEFAMLVTLMLASQAIRDAFAARTGNQGPTGTDSDGQLLKNQGCNSCHAEDHTVVGPAYVAIARKYAGAPGAIDRLTQSIREGEKGTWGTAAMPPHPDIPMAPLRRIVAWILSQKAANPRADVRKPKKYTYTLRNQAACSRRVSKTNWD